MSLGRLGLLPVFLFLLVRTSTLALILLSVCVNLPLRPQSTLDVDRTGTVTKSINDSGIPHKIREKGLALEEMINSKLWCLYVID